MDIWPKIAGIAVGVLILVAWQIMAKNRVTNTEIEPPAIEVPLNLTTDEAVEMLRRSVPEWNEYRANGGVIPSLSGVDFMCCFYGIS